MMTLLAGSDPVWEGMSCFASSRVLGRQLVVPFSPRARLSPELPVSLCASDNHPDSWKATLISKPGPHKAGWGSRSQLLAGKSQILRNKRNWFWIFLLFNVARPYCWRKNLTDISAYSLEFFKTDLHPFLFYSNVFCGRATFQWCPFKHKNKATKMHHLHVNSRT